MGPSPSPAPGRQVLSSGARAGGPAPPLANRFTATRDGLETKGRLQSTLARLGGPDQVLPLPGRTGRRRVGNGPNGVYDDAKPVTVRADLSCHGHRHGDVSTPTRSRR